MKIAIHNADGSFSERWISYCREKSIDFKPVNCYDSDIIDQISDCDGLMWSHFHGYYPDVLFAKQLLFAVEHCGKKVFPNFFTGWHFDDKVGQKYLLESAGAPLVPSYVFYSRKEALDWCNVSEFPKVFKLRGGAGSSNVSLVKTRKSARHLIRKAFNRGFPQFNRLDYLKERIRMVSEKREAFTGIFKGLLRFVVSTSYSRKHSNEKGYIYFQDFMPGNTYDIRIVVIGNKAFGAKRMVRKNDFRASGGGDSLFARSEVDERCVRIAFDVSRQLNTQSLAYDFVYDEYDNPLITEVSYCWPMMISDRSVGYWDSKLNWYDEKMNPQVWQIEDFIAGLKTR